MAAAAAFLVLLAFKGADATSHDCVVNEVPSNVMAHLKSIGYRPASSSCAAPTPAASTGSEFSGKVSMFTSQENNYCHGKKPSANAYFDNTNCTLASGVNAALEQSGTNVTLGYNGLVDTSDPARSPITEQYWKAGLCAVNVHWHLGTEHLSVGEYDEYGTGPPDAPAAHDSGYRRLAGDVRRGFRCHYYDATDPKFTTEYNWQHCVGMHVGETYEVHWPHSAAGACGTPYQYQTPFYDGVFCIDGIVSLDPLNTYTKIGVQGQIFTIVNDESLYYPNLIAGMIVDQGQHGTHTTKYTGSTTGTSRSNEICSKYTPITWQVDRLCHMISASSFDKMCHDMKEMAADMSDDLHAHGARELVLDRFAADNFHHRARV